MSLTCLPRRVSQCLRVLGPCFPHWHHLVFSWLLVLHLVYGERANLKALSRHGPQHLAYQHYHRLLCMEEGQRSEKKGRQGQGATIDGLCDGRANRRLVTTPVCG